MRNRIFTTTSLIILLLGATTAVSAQENTTAQENATTQKRSSKQKRSPERENVSYTLSAQDTIAEISVSNTEVERNGKYLTVSMTLDLSELKVKRDEAVILTPCIIDGDDSLHAKSVGIYGRRHYLHTIRRSGKEMLTGEDEISYKAKKRPDTIEYTELLPFSEWMEESELQLHDTHYGCCNRKESEDKEKLIAREEEVVEEPISEPIYVMPVVETKDLSLYIDFPINKSDIYQSYHDNAKELEELDEAINSVNENENIEISSITLKGYASPEGSYETNNELAKARAEALKEYIEEKYDIPVDIITTRYDAEDWKGLKAYVEESGLGHRDEILEIINSHINLDEKEAKLKSEYPEEYDYLLRNCNPQLRHTDVTINYTLIK